MSAGPTIADGLRDAAGRLASVTDTARLDAELLMAHVLRASRSDLLLRHMRDPVPAGFEALVTRRLAHEPIAYIIGEQEFYGRPFKVAPGVLIPRSDSESVVEAALEVMPENGRMLDCGTGTGALLLTILAERPQASGVGIDAADTALSIAAANARALQLESRAQIVRADWTQAGWADALGQFDLVMSNPPYVEAGARLDRQVREWEPGEALFAGADGLDDYRILIPQLRGLLNPGGAAVLEIGSTQADAVGDLARAEGFAVQLRRDLAERPRGLILR